MNVLELQDMINKLDYWDEKVLDFSIKYFGDEITLVIADTVSFSERGEQFCNIIRFKLCVRVNYETDAFDENWRKGIEVKNMSSSQLGHYAQDILIKESTEKDSWEVEFNTSLLFVKLVCKDISIEHKKYDITDFFWCRN